MRGLAAAVERLPAAQPGDRRVVFTYRPRPQCVLLDLAVQAAGRMAEPVAEEVWPPLAESADPGARSDWREGAPGGVVTVARSGAPRELDAAALARAAAGLDAALGPAASPRPRREVLVSGRCLADLGERLLLAWALAAGAAVVLAPALAEVVPVAAWARPTLFHGDDAEVAELARRAAAHRPPWPQRLWRRWRRKGPDLPFGRLHSVLCRTPAPQEADEFLSRRGCRLLGPAEAEAGLDAAV